MLELIPLLFEIIKGLGIAGGPVFAGLWWLERRERINCQEVTKELLVQTLTATSQSTFAITTVTTIITELREAMKDSFNSLARSLRKA